MRGPDDVCVVWNPGCIVHALIEFWGCAAAAVLWAVLLCILRPGSEFARSCVCVHRGSTGSKLSWRFGVGLVAKFGGIVATYHLLHKF